MAGGGKIRFWRGFFRQGCCGQAGHPVRRGPVRLHFGKVDRAGPPSRTPASAGHPVSGPAVEGGKDALPPLIKRTEEGEFEGGPPLAPVATGWRPAGPCPLATQEPYGHRQQRCDRMAARRAVPVATQEAMGIDSRDEGAPSPPPKKP